MIKLDNSYSLENDSNQWVLNFREEGGINPKTNKPIIRTSVWYCGSLTSCLSRYINEVGKPSKDIKELINILNIANNVIIKIDFKNKTK